MLSSRGRGLIVRSGAESTGLRMKRKAANQCAETEFSIPQGDGKVSSNGTSRGWKRIIIYDTNMHNSDSDPSF